MAGLWQRLKTWIDDETLYNSDLNDEFDNVQANSVLSEIEGHSSLNNIPSDDLMDAEEDPYPNLVRNYAVSAGDEVEQLRFMLAQITGNAEWYIKPLTNLSLVQAALGAIGALPQNYVKSGAVNAGGGALALLPSVSANSVVLKATATPIVVTIAGLNYTISLDYTLTSLSLAPATNNTANILDVAGNGKYVGEDGTKFVLSAVGSSITALIGQYAAFKVVHSAVTEYFIGYVESSILISRVKRGFFNDGSGVPIGRVAAAPSDTITLCKLAYLFLKSDGSLDVCYTQLNYGSVAPTSAASGDYWFDSANQLWKKYSGTAFVSASAILFGMSIQDTANCVGARTFKYHAVFDTINTMVIEANASGSTLVSSSFGQKISVAGQLFEFGQALAHWDVTGPFAPGVSLTANTIYYAYITQNGEQILDIVKPYDSQSGDLGFYHPYNLWRCVGFASTDVASAFTGGFSNYGMLHRPPALSTNGVSTPGGMQGTDLATGLDGFAISSNIALVAAGSSETNLANLPLKTTGRPVEMGLISNGAAGSITNVDAGAIEFTMDGIPFSNLVASIPTIAGVGGLAPSMFRHIFVPPGGEHIFGAWAKTGSANTMSVTNCKFYVKEL